MPHLKLLPDARGKMHSVMVPSRRTGGRGHKKGKHRFRKHLGFFSKSWVKLALVVMVAEALAVTVLAGLPKWVSPQALVLWLYGSWKKNKQALAIAAVFQAARLASAMGLTASVATAASGIKLAGLGIGGGGGAGGAVGAGSGYNPGAQIFGGGTQLANAVNAGIGSVIGGGGAAAGGQSSNALGQPVPAGAGGLAPFGQDTNGNQTYTDSSGNIVYGDGSMVPDSMVA